MQLLHPTTCDLQNQLIQLQSQITFMEATLDTLNDIVTKQNQQLSAQQRQLQLLYQKISTMPTESQIQPFDVLADKPPHY
ncbi:putative SlyX protein [Moraxella macacae 0408225]|uniref:Putative SlyX protein n=1 Tax=Moraxella macacae 0408225 TaxID=1230338 RepID=L2F6E2_9GAMM|nr:SlyX family protein [Moraxella macacae]ELA08485.1 putative SlyX protein [Moraxella macacae 0408225]